MGNGSEHENGRGGGSGEPSLPHLPITELTGGTGIILTPNPITTTGTIEIDGSVLPNLEGDNTFTGDQTITGNVILTGSINDGLVIEPNPTSPNIIGGSSSNTVDSGVVGGTIGGGGTAAEANLVLADFATVGGGSGNQAGGAPVAPLQSFATLGNGDALGGNTAQFHGVPGQHSTVGGGLNNNATADYSTVSGGIFNTASGVESTVGGGRFSQASGNHSTVGGGDNNEASGNLSTVSGGRDNSASTSSTVGGGDSNEALGFLTTVGGALSTKPAEPLPPWVEGLAITPAMTVRQWAGA